MTIKLNAEAHNRFIASIKRFSEESLDDEMGDLKASLLLTFVLREIAPTIYNQAITDAQTRLQDAVMDLDGSCHEPDLGYWNKR
jgi:uncharacterized protein (DUF2164 family)